MTDNYLTAHIDQLFEECTLINANLYVTNSFLKERVNQLRKSFPINGFELISMGSSFRDLSQLEGGNNLFPTSKNYILFTDELETEADRILSFYSCVTISQVFEVFETFLKDSLTELIFNNNELLKTLKLEIEVFEIDKIRYSISGIQGKNNKGLIKAIRKLSPFFNLHESNNIWGLNMTDWYKLIAIVRHIIVHQRQKVPEDFLSTIKTHGLQKLFERHFQINNNLLYLTPYESDVIINHLYEYAYLIYKGLSIDFKLKYNFYKSY